MSAIRLRKNIRKASFFNVNKGRILDSWQLLYIHSGKGTMYDEKGNVTQINCGEMILLRPGVWHSYTPDQKPF